ncbi:hypothetical protein [Streptomyces sp. NPDC048496]|uniref:hypothetical protein n=1 Tax=Streptomyces sp. NPDC048496 TaxID=3365558 RepID=UPI0037114ABD
MRRLQHRSRWTALTMTGLVAALAAALLGAPAEPAHAATPASAVLDEAHKSVTWQSPVYPKGTVGGPGVHRPGRHGDHPQATRPAGPLSAAMPPAINAARRCPTRLQPRLPRLTPCP